MRKLIFAIVMAAGVSLAQEEDGNWERHFFPPELVVHHGKAIGLSEEQIEKAEQTLRQAHEKFQQWEAELLQARRELAAMTSEEKVDEEKVLAQLDEVLKRERRIKRAHLRLVTRIKNKLNAQQQKRLQEVHGKVRSLGEKMRRIEQGVKEWSEAGRDPSRIGDLVSQEFEPLMEDGKFDEAGKILDRALKILDEEE